MQCKLIVKTFYLRQILARDYNPKPLFFNAEVVKNNLLRLQLRNDGQGRRGEAEITLVKNGRASIWI